MEVYTNIIIHVGIPFLPSTSNKVYFFIAFRECILFTKGFRLNALQENKGIYKYLVSHLIAILNLPYFIINDVFYQNYIRRYMQNYISYLSAIPSDILSEVKL